MAVIGLSSMATRALLAELAAAWTGGARMEAVGGVEAARRLREGEAFDVVVLAGGAMRALEAEGVLLPGSLVGIAVSAVAAAVRDGEAVPGLESEGAVREAVLQAGRVGYSTGPSGEHLLRLLERWGIRDALGERLVQAPPGTPVGALLAAGAVDLAFQQRSELMGVPGIVIAGGLPEGARGDTVFTAGIPRSAERVDAARAFIAFLGAADTDAVKRRHGMEPV